MSDFLIRHFIKNCENTNDAHVRDSYGQLSGIVGIIANAIICTLKIITGLIFSSIAIVADGINNLSDAANSVITLIGFRLSAKPADKDHPFGHARYEYISGLLVSFIIILIGLSLLKSSVIKIISPETADFGILTVAVLILSIMVKLWLYLFNKKISKAIDSLTVMATARDCINDVFSTSGVLISLLIGYFFQIQIDGIAGTVISLFVIISGIGLVNDTLSPLLGEGPKEELVKMLESEICEYPSVIGIHDLVVHNYGKNKCFATVHVEVPAKQSITKSHDIVDTIENEILHKHGIHMVIHMDPVETDNVEVLFLKDSVTKKIKELSSELSIHDFRVAFGDTHNNIIFDVVVPVDFYLSDNETEAKIDSLVKEIDKKNNAVIKIDKKYYN